jgi:hypothetical protein
MFISRGMFLPTAVTVNLIALYTVQYYAALLSNGLHIVPGKTNWMICTVL